MNMPGSLHVGQVIVGSMGTKTKLSIACVEISPPGHLLKTLHICRGSESMLTLSSMPHGYIFISPIFGCRGRDGTSPRSREQGSAFPQSTHKPPSSSDDNAADITERDIKLSGFRITGDMIA